MNKNKLTHVHVYIIGFVLMLMVGGGLFYTLLKPLDDQNKVLKADVATKETTQVSVDNANFTIATTPAAEKKLVEAEARRAEKASKLAAMERIKQLPPSEQLVIPKEGADIKTSLPRWFLIQPKVVQRMKKFAEDSAKKHGVKVTTSFAAGAPTTDVKSIKTDILAMSLGPITIEGPFPNVMAYARDWNSAPLLVSIDGLKCSLAGRKGIVQASAAVTTYVFPTGPGVTSPGGGGPGGSPGAPGMPPDAGGGPPPTGTIGGPGGKLAPKPGAKD